MTLPSPRPIDPILRAALAIHSSPGVYAILVGSGISRPAGIPTGWEVVLDLIRKLGRAMGDDVGEDPAGWYKATFGAEPHYGDLLEQLAGTQAERRDLLKEYFEPSSEDGQSGLKRPTAAHRAIAKLVTGGSVRVIVTTNFDRLLESAIQEAGVTPVVITTPDAAIGAPPLVHSPCTILKVNGDYLDARIRNTSGELEAYDEVTTRLLETVFEDYGLIIAGWSSEWDIALRSSLERKRARRYSTFWSTLSEDAGETAGPAMALLGATHIRGTTADRLFHELSQYVSALASVGPDEPISTGVAVARLKRYLPDDAHRIDLHDLAQHEVSRACSFVDSDLSVHSEVTPDLFLARVEHYESGVDRLATILATGSYFGTPSQVQHWITAIERLANAWNKPWSGKTAWLMLTRYPAALCLYATGVAAVAAGRWDTLYKLLTRPHIRELDGEFSTAVEELHISKVMTGAGTFLPGMERHHTPGSERLETWTRRAVAGVIPDDHDYVAAFELFEHLLCLAYIAVTDEDWAPIGCYGWRHHGSRPDDPANRVTQEPLSSDILSAFFLGDDVRATQVSDKLKDHLKKARSRWLV